MALNVAVYGYATDLGKLILETLDEIKVPVANLYPLSPLDGEFDAVKLYGRNYPIEFVDNFDFSKADAALFLTTSDESQRLMPKAVEQGCIVIDTSSLYSGTDTAQLILPELNPYDLKKGLEKRLIIPPHATATAIVLALKDLHDEFEVTSIEAVSLEAVSELGSFGVQHLASEAAGLLSGRGTDEGSFLDAQIAFNLHTRIGTLNDQGLSSHEAAVVRETEYFLGHLQRGTAVTSCLLPVFFGHTICLHITLQEKVSKQQVLEILKESEYLNIQDDNGVLITPVTHGLREKKPIITRLRQSTLKDHGFDLVVVFDNLGRGEAITCVKILKLMADMKK